MLTIEAAEIIIAVWFGLGVMGGLLLTVLGANLTTLSSRNRIAMFFGGLAISIPLLLVMITPLAIVLVK